MTMEQRQRVRVKEARNSHHRRRPMGKCNFTVRWLPIMPINVADAEVWSWWSDKVDVSNSSVFVMEKDNWIHHVTSNGSVEREKSVSFRVKSVLVLILFVLLKVCPLILSLFLIEKLGIFIRYKYGAALIKIFNLYWLIVYATLCLICFNQVLPHGYAINCLKKNLETLKYVWIGC